MKNQFDKNKGYNSNFDNSSKGPVLENRNLLKADKELKPLKMNFFLFLKSFDLISNRIYKEYSSDQAIELFFEHNINLLINKKFEVSSTKKNNLDILNQMRREEIVY